MTRLKPNARLTDAQIVEIKLIGIAGDTSAGPVARLYQVGVETIRKIWRGETHQDVVVAGEEGIRGRGPLPDRPQAPGLFVPSAPSHTPTGGASESARRLLEELEDKGELE